MKTPLMRLVEIEFDQPLEDLLTKWWEEGRSYGEMALIIRSRGIDVSGPAVRTWIPRLGLRPTLVRFASEEATASVGS